MLAVSAHISFLGCLMRAVECRLKSLWGPEVLQNSTMKGGAVSIEQRCSGWPGESLWSLIIGLDRHVTRRWTGLGYWTTTCPWPYLSCYPLLSSIFMVFVTLLTVVPFFGVHMSLHLHCKNVVGIHFDWLIDWLTAERRQVSLLLIGHRSQRALSQFSWCYWPLNQCEP